MIVEHLIADTFGTHIGKYQGRLQITQNGAVLSQAPILHLRTVHVISNGISISSDVLRTCAEEGIPIFFLSSRGQPYASIYASGLSGTVLTRRAQLLSYYDQRGIMFALAIARGKIANQSITLKYMAKNRKDAQPEIYELLRDASDAVIVHQADLNRIRGQSIDEVREQIMGTEGHAAKVYWEAIRAIVPDGYQWEGREGRGAQDAVNSLLNYGYGILYSQIEQCVVLAGLDPYAGFLHADRPGKPSLVLDMIEEFRQVAVDRVVFGLVNRGYTVQQDETGRLTEAFRRDYAEKITQNLENTVRYEGKRFPLRYVIQMQARHLAVFLRGEREDYAPYKAQW